MSTFGKRLEEFRKAQNMSQREVATLFETSISAVGKWERDLMVPSVVSASKMAKLLGTTVGYLLGETEQENIFKDVEMLERLQKILDLPQKERECILSTIDHFIKGVKHSQI